MRAVPLGEMPNKLRIAIAMTAVRQNDVAEETGVLASDISDFVNGKYPIAIIQKAGRLAEFFGCSIEDIFPAREGTAA